MKRDRETHLSRITFFYDVHTMNFRLGGRPILKHLVNTLYISPSKKEKNCRKPSIALNPIVRMSVLARRDSSCLGIVVA